MQVAWPEGTRFKSCGECNLCCRLLDFPELDKPAGAWCRHCVQGSGCGIHETRPEACRVFQCQWSVSEALPDFWRPDRAHFFLWAQNPGQLICEVDPDQPQAWRTEPYYSGLKYLSAQPGLQVIVRVDEHMHMVFPEADIDMGRQQPTKQIDWGYRMDFAGKRTPYARFIDPVAAVR